MLTIIAMNDHELIDSLGGTAAVAQICGITPQAVSQWKRNGIPKSVSRLLRHYRDNTKDVDQSILQPTAE